jgi:purine-nucleoside phosphorylase
MTKFEALFGIKESRIKKTCVLMPLVRNDILKWLGAGSKLSKGKLYSTADAGHFTLIRTGIGPALTGDAVLYLEKTKCQNIILFGSCGLIKKTNSLGIGNIVTPEKSYSFESFTEMLLNKKKMPHAFYPDKNLLGNLLKIDGPARVTCATLGSLKLEEDLAGLLSDKDIHVADMECSAVFSAAAYIHRNATAIFYITDIIGKKPFYRKLPQADETLLFSSIKSICAKLCKFLKKNLNA